MKNTLRIQRAVKGGISQRDLAKIMGVAGQTIHTIEINKFVPSVKLCLRIAKYFGRPLEEIFFLEEGEENFNLEGLKEKE